MEPNSYNTITREKLKEKLDRRDKFQLVNVLSHESFEEEHIPGSINVPVDHIRHLAPRLWKKNDEIIVYCADFECHASPTASKILVQMGYANVTDYEGGMQDWEAAGYEVASGHNNNP